MKPTSTDSTQATGFPSQTYAEIVLEPAYNQARQHLLNPMMAVNKAHLIMLCEQHIIPEKEAFHIASALQRLDVDKLRTSEYSSRVEDLFFQVENELEQLGGESTGNLHLARSRNDMGIAIYRMVLREKLSTAITSGLALHRSLRKFALRHIHTLMIAHTHTQQAHPTTLAHYICAVNDSLERDLERLKAAYVGCNRSSLGAAALTTSGFPVSRERTAELLGFDEVIENAYDAVSGADYAGEAASAAQLAAINLGRFVQDLLLWCTQEYGGLVVAAPYVQISSIMPQKRNPVSLEHARSLLSSAKGDTSTVLHMIHNTPFGDIVDTEDDMQPYLWKSLNTLESVYRLLSEIIDTLKVNESLLRKRAENSFATVTELADTLVRTDGLSFRKAHSIVSHLVTQLTESGTHISGLTWDMVNQAVQDLSDKPLALTRENLRDALSPQHFVYVRQVLGGPNPDEVKRVLANQAIRLNAKEKWNRETVSKLRSVDVNLNGILNGRPDRT
ncbi:argininosuccinate lyase [Paenibacillus sp. LS1]|uniref:argininosuccinate lyase n=1 Tax=Paenibacillus sp. LS1 TaxID=2992120 RepID=UPI002231F069|nr:argininosuccinate lyase [Paenibacillus sp. LS1]MCW3791614.1 argininosuccinate lyase [Paenibacillus sp. LS1]